MKAIVYYENGSPDVLKYEEIEKPTPADDEVLIKVRAASVNPLDSHLMNGLPSVFRMLFRARKPKINRPGVDVAGEIEAVGRNVSEFKPGDAVFGMCKGTFAEYVCAPESAVILKPQNVTFEQAASAPVAAFTALQGLRDKGRLQSAQKVLVNGAAGGVGSFTVQIAKSFGAHVTAVCSARNAEMVRSIGADHVIDYTREDFTKNDERYDLIFDLVSNHSLSAYRRVLNPKGVCLIAGILGTTMIRFAPRLIAAPVLSRCVSQTFVFFTAKQNKQDLIAIAHLMETGRLRPVIDKCYRLSEVPKAIRYLQQGHAHGKLVITL